MALSATVNQSAPVQMAAADGNTALFAQARVYNAAGAVVTTINLTHMAEGIYAGTWTPTIEGYFTVVYQFYTDAGYTTPAAYDKQAETFDVNSIKTNLLRILALHNENSVIDQQVYNPDGNITSARIRCYDSKANALLASTAGLQFQYAMSASYAGTFLSNFTMTREL